MKFSMFGRVTSLILAAVCLDNSGYAQQPVPSAPGVRSLAPPALPVAPAVSTLQQPGSSLRLRNGDSMEIRLGGVPAEEINQVTGTYVVDTQGFVNMPHIGRIKAAGLAQEQLQAAIENTYRQKEIYSNPTITVSVPMQVRFVNVGGEVRMPQRVPYTPDLTLIAALSAAGGLTEYASQARVRLVRGNKIIKIDIRKVRKDPSLDVPLEPGDLIEVMRSFF